MKYILYKEYNEKTIANGERVTISTAGGCTVSTFIDFLKSGLTLATRENMSFWGFNRVITFYLNNGYKIIKTQGA